MASDPGKGLGEAKVKILRDNIQGIGKFLPIDKRISDQIYEVIRTASDPNSTLEQYVHFIVVGLLLDIQHGFLHDDCRHDSVLPATMRLILGTSAMAAMARVAILQGCYCDISFRSSPPAAARQGIIIMYTFEMGTVSYWDDVNSGDRYALWWVIVKGRKRALIAIFGRDAPAVRIYFEDDHRIANARPGIGLFQTSLLPECWRKPELEKPDHG
ncbi:Uu.00g134730.m01.CDS01 [Anthostomella pinea]|uniref:Uu.00g134730.m01.CDS01 n=1 Tax=Anthostomella pinea TaxID=933095 RepID=A0AAI8YKQ8_9PEZI|nr:Uu.00g134730.m01.CDS01 [Anthostomella pinea]